MRVRAYAWMGREEVRSHDLENSPGIPSLRSGFRVKHLHDLGS